MLSCDDRPGGYGVVRWVQAKKIKHYLLFLKYQFTKTEYLSRTNARCKSSRPFMATGMFGVTVERILVDDVPLSFSLTVVKLA